MLDVLLLIEVEENFAKNRLVRFNPDPQYFEALPSLSWKAASKTRI